MMNPVAHKKKQREVARKIINASTDDVKKGLTELWGDELAQLVIEFQDWENAVLID